MSPITSPTNAFAGINPILNSRLQSDGSAWEEFHLLHIAHLFEALNQAVRPLGYRASLIPGLQVRLLDVDSGEWSFPRRLEPDVNIRLSSGGSTTGAITSPAAQPGTIVLTIPETQAMDAEALLKAIAIYDVETLEHGQGRPVTWLELLSPSNKPGGRHGQRYAEKRLNVLQSGQTLLEIDFLHEQPPVIHGLPATPYYICVSQPRPSISEGTATVYPFGVDEPIPAVDIPLAGDEAIAFDFDAVYQRTFESVYAPEVDYAQAPARFETYSEADRAAIQERMKALGAG
jgi:hypothetical protein